MSSEMFYVVKQEGEVERWDITKRRLATDAALEQAFSANVTRRNATVLKFTGDYGTAGVSMNVKFEVWSVRVLSLGLEAPFKVVDGVHTPDFISKSEPNLPMKWEPPSSMKLVLGVVLIRDSKGMVPGEHYLVAFDSSQRMWRLPVSNLYDDCKLCHGQVPKPLPTSLECVSMACDMFSKSRWNADLYNPDDKTRMAATECMFRFKVNKTGFDQLPMKLKEGKDWTSLCQKIASEKLNSMIMPV